VSPFAPDAKRSESLYALKTRRIDAPTCAPRVAPGVPTRMETPIGATVDAQWRNAGWRLSVAIPEGCLCAGVGRRVNV